MKRILCILLALVLCCTFVTPVLADNDATPYLLITKTEIRADSVTNSGGYASLKVNPEVNDQYELVKKPQSALMDRYGRLTFPFRDTWLDFHYDPASSVVSLVGSKYSRRYYWRDGDELILDQPAYYHLNGSPILQNGFAGGTPMHDGYAVILENLPESEWKPYKDSDWMEVTSILKLIDSTGRPVYTFPDEFGVEIGGFGDYYWGEIGYMETAGTFGEGSIGLQSWNDTMPIRFVNSTGSPVLETAAYTACGMFSEGLAAVYSPEKQYWGYMDKSGTEVISCIYDDALPFSDGLAAVALNDKWGCVDREGNVLIPLAYDDCFGAAEGLVAVKKDGKCGLVDYNNNVVLPFVYDDISSCEGGVAYAISGRVVYIIRLIRDASRMFTDVPSDAWYHNAVNYCVREGLFNGTSDTTFEPLGTMTRAMFVMVLANAYGVDTSDNDVPTEFTDVPRNQWYTLAVKWAHENGIVSGVGDGLFKPNDPVTREQICVMIEAYCGFIQRELTAVRPRMNFNDAYQIAHWASHAVETCQMAGLVEGYNGYFYPKNYATRAEVAQIFTNLFE